jgi:enamine deaminase RidA (YjgF/YER057c/UK114 family)
MTPRRDGQLTAQGRVGVDVTAAAARQAAGVAAENALAAVADAGGGLNRVRTCLRLTVYVACADDFVELSAVADGASAALEAHLGPGGRPARTAVGVRSLPGGAPVEVELMVAVRTG